MSFFALDLAHGKDITRIHKYTQCGDVCVVVEATVDDMAKEYVELLYTKPNGWGQHVHPAFGQSHHMMMIMADVFGNEIAQQAISRALAERKPNQCQDAKANPG